MRGDSSVRWLAVLVCVLWLWLVLLAGCAHPNSIQDRIIPYHPQPVDTTHAPG